MVWIFITRRHKGAPSLAAQFTFYARMTESKRESMSQIIGIGLPYLSPKSAYQNQARLVVAVKPFF
jgi:hypothetical protein